MGKYLDKAGLQALWNALKGKCVLINEDGTITLKSKDETTNIKLDSNILNASGSIFEINSHSPFLSCDSSSIFTSILGIHQIFLGLTTDVETNKFYIQSNGVSFIHENTDHYDIVDFYLNENGDFLIRLSVDRTHKIKHYKFNFDKMIELGILSEYEEANDAQALNLESMSADELVKLSPSQIRKIPPSQLAKAVKIVSESRASSKSDAQAQVTT